MRRSHLTQYTRITGSMNDTKTIIPQADIEKALNVAVDVLAQSSLSHAEEIGGYIRSSFQPNPELVPIGVAVMFQLGLPDLEKALRRACYPEVMFNVVSNMVLVELRKLPGVDKIFTKFEEQDQ